MSDTPTESMLDDRIAELEDENAALQQENAALRAKVAAQGLSLACLADGILGEDAADRSDQTLVRVGCRMARENAALRADKERMDWLIQSGLISGRERIDKSMLDKTGDES